jgi:hypothetical protein
MHLAEHAAGHCNCNQPTQPARGTGDDRAGTANDAAQAAAAGVGAAGAGVDGAGADGVDAAGVDADGANADAGFNRATSPATAAVPATGIGELQRIGPVRTTGVSSAAGDPGVFAATTGGVQSGSGCAVRPSQWVNPRYLALLRVDAAALRRGHVQDEELCEIAGIGPVPVSVVRDLLGEAIVKLVITNGVDVLNVTHLGRGPTTAQKIALMWTNPRCSVHGCDRRRIEYDHQKPWADTRHTRLDELDPLCGFHHDLKTRLHWALVAGKGKRAFVPPNDPRHPRYRKPRANPSGGQVERPWAVRDTTRPRAASAASAAPGKASRPRTARRAASAQMTLLERPAEQAPQPP